MRIERLVTYIACIPIDRTIVQPDFAPVFKPPTATRGYVFVEIYTDNGLFGLGCTISAQGWLLRPLESAIHELGQLLLGDDPLEIETQLSKMRSYTSFLGPGGFVNFAMAAIDIALWDLAAKAKSLPLYKLLGGHTPNVPVYASGILYRGSSLETLQKEAAKYVEKGFTAVKMRLGGDSNLQTELDRVRVVRETVGDKVDIMIDVNQGWTPETAIRMGRKFENFDIYWLEDPVRADDFTGCAKVAKALDIPVVGGEYHYTRGDFQNMIDSKAVDMVMIDLARVGGISEGLKIAAMAAAWNLPVVTHLMPEFQCHLLAAISNGLILEFMPWSFPLFVDPPKFRNGHLHMSEQSGLGLELNKQALTQYTC